MKITIVPHTTTTDFIRLHEPKLCINIPVACYKQDCTKRTDTTQNWSHHKIKWQLPLSYSSPRSPQSNQVDQEDLFNTPAFKKIKNIQVATFSFKIYLLSWKPKLRDRDKERGRETFHLLIRSAEGLKARFRPGEGQEQGTPSRFTTRLAEAQALAPPATAVPSTPASGLSNTHFVFLA